MQRAAAIVTELFAKATSPGALRMREHALATADMRVDLALELLREMFHDDG